MLAARFKGSIEKITLPVGRVLVRIGLSPDFLTLLGLAWSLLAGALAAAERYRPAGLALLVAGLMDLLDGPVARASAGATRAGAFLDSVCDRVGEGAVLAGLGWSLREDPWGLGGALAALVFGYLVSYTKARAESLGMRVPGGLAERAERTLVLMMGLLLSRPRPFLWFLALLSSFTALQRGVAGVRSGGR